MGLCEEDSEIKQIFHFICGHGDGGIKRIDIIPGELSIRTASQGELELWQSEQNGGFRQYARNVNKWDKLDERKFSLLIRGRTTFFVVHHEDSLQIFPESGSAH